MTVGEIRASVTLENSWDRENVDRGLGVETDVRRTTVEGIVDTGAVNLVIPEEIATELVVRHVTIFGHGHGLQRAIIDKSQHREPERLIMAQH